MLDCRCAAFLVELRVPLFQTECLSRLVQVYREQQCGKCNPTIVSWLPYTFYKHSALQVKPTPLSMHKAVMSRCWLVLYSISTLVGYLTPNPVYIYIYIYIYNLEANSLLWTVSSKYSLNELLVLIYLQTVKWIKVALSNTNNPF